ncbi:hypothetical protein QFX18_19265 [Saccharophagus degradans]|uniref:DUF6882 domain-containing protein n=1 Tax=Saccharophagus degradans TaxID=86304 RepID=UPI0024780AD6|nr:DUF6882 domain-containing protein [Saccharophagus degradans]WGO98150.1 hypothetical protein QFX18_19265 [Saccharophagus degradans]
MLRKLFGKKKDYSFDDLNAEQDEYLGLAISEYNEKRKIAFEMYSLDKYSWFFDQDNGEFQLKDDENIIYVGDGQIIGSYYKPDQSWEWAWNNPNWKKQFIADSLLVKEYGRKQKLGYFQEGMLPIGSEEYAQYLTSVGVKISESDFAYHGDTGDLVVYIMLKNVRKNA